MLEAALAAGCDAVYFGLPQYGARAYAKNFTMEQAREVIQRCHLAGVKVHITMNTILFEEEIEPAYQQAKQLYEYGVDALIIQDLGLMHLLHTRLPDLVIHASTQLSTRTPQEIEKLKKLGVRRVVLARECSRDEIERCKKAGLEIEIFVHGALCISMSGRCYLSQVCYGRSGNRGRCSQPCRMPYTLWMDGRKVHTPGEYLLSPKDLSLIDQAGKLDVDSLKIEGRMKSPVYVYEAVRQVKKVLEGKKRTQEDRERLKQAFNRGYTTGHMDGMTGYELMNTTAGNHQGIPAGQVVGVSKKKIRIHCQIDIHQYDGLRIGLQQGCRINYLYDARGNLTNEVKKGHIAQIDALPNIHIKDMVVRTVSYQMEQEVRKIAQTTIRKIPVKAQIICEGFGQPLRAIANDGQHTVFAESAVKAVLAKKQPTTPAVIEKQMKKTKDSWIVFTDITYDLEDGLFFPIGVLNDLRRQIIERLKKEREKAAPVSERPYLFRPFVEDKEARYVQTVPEDTLPAHWNVTNSYGVAAALEMGYTQTCLSDECDVSHMEQLVQAFQRRYHQPVPVVWNVYQKRRLMIMRHCPVNTACKDGTRTKCALCHTHMFYLKGKDGNTFLCQGNEDCYMCLYDTKATNLLSEMGHFHQLGIHRFLLSFVDETEDKRKELLEQFKRESY